DRMRSPCRLWTRSSCRCSCRCHLRSPPADVTRDRRNAGGRQASPKLPPCHSRRRLHSAERTSPHPYVAVRQPCQLLMTVTPAIRARAVADEPSELSAERAQAGEANGEANIRDG